MKRRILFAFIAIGLVCVAVRAQPTDAALKKQLTHPTTVSITLGKPGKTEWSSTYKKWIWTRYATIKMKTEDPGIFLVWYGYAAYDVVGGRFNYWRTFTTSNTYEGIPDLTNADLPRLVDTFGYKVLFSEFHFNRIPGGQVESFKLAPDPKFVWSNPNAVEFTTVAVYVTDRNSDQSIGKNRRVEGTFRIKLMRPNVKSEWNWAINLRAEIRDL